MVEDDPGLPPVALHGPFGNLAHRGDLPEGEAAEKVEVHQLGERGIELGQLIQGQAELAERLGVSALRNFLAREREQLELPATLARGSTPGIVYDQSAHR